MKATEYREMSSQDLTSELSSMVEQLFRLRFQKATGQLGDQGRLRQVRKDIARAKTVLREKTKQQV